jgi:hypothetical protein
MKKYITLVFISSIMAFLFTGCSSIFGDKEDEQVNDIFKQGAIDPELVPQNVGYVPLYPFFINFSNPVDVYVGYDELVYVVDDNGLNILDLKGTKYQTIPIQGATDVTQDRRLHTYVTGTVTLPRGQGGAMVTLAAVYRLSNTATGNYIIEDTLIHPDCDESRSITAFRGTDDELVRFTGLTTLHDNTLYVSRTGPRNDPNSFVVPDNSVLVYDAIGKNIGSARGLTPNSANLRSALNISSLAGYSGPPQRQEGMNTSKSFYLTQADQGTNIEYRVLNISVQDDPDAGTQYSENASLLSFDFTKGNRFLYEPFRFKKPEDCYVSPDNLQYLFVVDSELDSLFIFTNQGVEGVNAPATFASRKQVIVSFGGTGLDGSNSGPFNFNDPSGVCYHRRVIYVADKKNNRVCRYVLNTDLQ